MSTLRDEAYEKLDYLSQLTEVIIAPQSELLSTIPDRIDLTCQDVMMVMSRDYSTLNAMAVYPVRVLQHCCSTTDYQSLNEIDDNFALEASPDFCLDIQNQVMTGTISLVKLRQQIDDKRLLQLAVNRATELLNSRAWRGTRQVLTNRVSTVMDTLEPNRGADWLAALDKSTKTARLGRFAARDISLLLHEVIMENKWRIRNTQLIVKMGEWINAYLTDDNVGLINLTKLRIMVDKDLPIYSIEEVKSVNPA